MEKKLSKKLGLFDVFCIASGAMVSSGLFILPGLASAKVGPALFLSYIIASILALPAMFSIAELTTAMPKAGGDYFYITRSMGLAVGTISGVATWFSLSLKSAFALVGMSAYITLITNVPIEFISIFLCFIFVGLNVIGVKEVSIFQRVLVVGLLGALAFYILKGFPAVKITRFEPFMPFGAISVLATAGFVFISYGGLTKIASIAEEVENPGRNIPLGMILSLIVVGIFYALVVFVATGVVPATQLHNSLTPISDSARGFAGTIGAIIMSIAAILAFISTANAGIMTASRYPTAMSRDKILPSLFKRINQRFNTPHNSVILTGIFIIFAILFLKLELLVKAASTFLILIFIFTSLAVIIMRESKIHNYQPKFKSPLYPWMQILGVIAGLFLIAEMGVLSYFIVGIFVIMGLSWYWFYVRKNVKQESALIHLVERITAKELTSDYLREELKGILRERDNIIEDRFDKVINRGEILDLGESIKMKEFFNIVAQHLSKKLDNSPDNIYDLLMEREKESSTVIREDLAIPHIVVGGEGKFEILIARCREGIEFPEVEERVHVVFVLAGSKDERNFHLQALSAIAQISQSENFDKKWLKAKDKNELRDILLLAKRRRGRG